MRRRIDCCSSGKAHCSRNGSTRRSSRRSAIQSESLSRCRPKARPRHSPRPRNGVLTYRARAGRFGRAAIRLVRPRGQLARGRRRTRHLPRHGSVARRHAHRDSTTIRVVAATSGSSNRAARPRASRSIRVEDNSSPIWSPDGRQIAFGSLRNGKWGLYRTTANGDGEE